MARPLRIELAGGLYHVTSRGDRREHIFLGDADREAWLAVFAQVCARFNWRCHAWCQMTNHYHIVIETAEANLAQGMRQLNGVYTQYANRAHSRVGHVFQGRYKAILVEKEGHLLELARYVVLNPLRAGMTQNVADWPWSSYSTMVGTAPCPDWLEIDWFLGQFSPQRTTAREQYIDFVRAGVGLPSIWGNLRNQIYLGDEAFVTQMQALNPENQQLTEVPRLQRRLNAKPLADYKTEYAEQPRLGMALAYLSGKYAMKAIAGVFSVHYTTVSRAIKEYELLYK
jgi:putative transposase